MMKSDHRLLLKKKSLSNNVRETMLVNQLQYFVQQQAEGMYVLNSYFA